jgi:hypothetical protein
MSVIPDAGFFFIVANEFGRVELKLLQPGMVLADGNCSRLARKLQF